MIPTGSWAGFPGNRFAFACKQRADPLGLCQGRAGEDSFGVCAYTVSMLVCETLNNSFIASCFCNRTNAQFSQKSQPVPFHPMIC